MKHILCLLVFFGSVSLIAQEQVSKVVSSGGGFSQGGNYTNFSVIGGEPVAPLITGGNYTSKAGFIFHDISSESMQYTVTFNVDMSSVPDFNPAEDIVYITGNMINWTIPGNDPDNQTMGRIGESMIWSKTMVLDEGQYEYKYFLNDGWGSGEWHGNPNRVILVDKDTEINDIWGYLPVVDIDGNTYATIIIGEQEWFAENLRVTHYQNGDPIPSGHDLGDGWPESDYYFAYDNDPDNIDIYGLLYTGFVVMDEREVCPTGWTIPTNDQWKVLEMQLGMTWEGANTWGIFNGHGTDEGGKLKATGFDYWDMPNVGAVDEVGFNARGAGSRYNIFTNINTTTEFFSSTIQFSSPILRLYNFNHPKTFRTSSLPGAAQSIRCIKIQQGQTVPDVETLDVESVQATSATIEAEVTGDGNATVIARGIAYSNFNEEPEVDTQLNGMFTSNGDGTGSFTAEISGLLPETTYYARAYAVNANGISFGETILFETQPGEIATLSNLTVTDRDQTSISLSSEVTDDGGSDVTSRGFIWSRSEYPVNHDNMIEVGSGIGEFSGTITGLNPNTLYFIRAFATNETGTSYSQRGFYFTNTDKPAPSVITESVSQITTNSAVVNANVTDDGGYNIMKRGIEVTWYDGSMDIVADGTIGEYTVNLTGLEANVEYTVRAYAINENGKSLGEPITFVTVFETADQALTFMQNQIYNYMYAFNALGGNHDFGIKSFDLTNDLMGEDMAIWSQGWGWFNRHYGYIDHKVNYLESGNAQLTIYTWHRYYELIDRANWILLHIDDATGDLAERDGIKGQALAMRAFAHFHLVQVFSHAYAYDPDAPGIPYVTENSKDYSRFEFETKSLKATDFKQLITLDESKTQDIGYKSVKGNEKVSSGILERGKVSDVYTQLQNDLDEAVSLLEGSGVQAHRSHIDLAVAHGLIARVALVMEDWDKAAEYAELAINTAETQGKQLYSSEEYTADGFNSVDGSEWMWGSEIGEDQHTFYASFYSHMDARFMSYASLGGQKLITQELYDMLPETDIRRNLFIAPGQGYGDLVDYNQMKFLTPDIGSFKGDYLYMRLAEMYLIRAEALAEKGEYVLAKQVLNDIISLRDFNYGVADITGQELIDEILNQRRLELWGEGHRSLDIRRLQIPLERPADDNHNPELANIFYLPANDEMFLWRIPFHSYLGIDVDGEGYVLVDGQLYEETLLIAGGSEITLNAVSDDGYEFVNWTDGEEEVSTDAEYTFTMPAEDVILTANFALTDYTVSATVEPEDTGSVTGEGTYNMGDEVTLAATASTGYEFVNWTDGEEEVSTDAEYTFTMPAEDVILTANFASAGYALTIVIEPEGAGTVTIDPEQDLYNDGDMITLTAAAAEGYEFINWTDVFGNYITDEAEYEFTMPAEDATLNANFKESGVSVEEPTKNDISIFPNPTRNKFTIKSNEKIKHIRLIDINGNVIKDKVANELSYDLNVHDLQTGMYFIQIRTDNTVVTIRVQVAR